MSKPTQPTIDLSIELHKLGVRKEKIEVGDFYLVGKAIRFRGENDLVMMAMLDGENNLCDVIPIWTDCDECIKWLLEKGYEVKIRPIKKGVAVTLTSSNVLTWGDIKAPTLIEALLKAMVEVAGKKEKA